MSPAYRRYALAAMTSVYMLNLVDRHLMILLLQPIKMDLHLSDTQLGFVTGIAFGLFYAVLGLPIARWSDRGNRVTITSLAIGLWGLTVMASLFVTNYTQLVFARVAAAVGESGCKPPTYSLVGDYFPGSAERTRAMTIYMAGSSVASLVSYIVGGWLNELYGWRMTFFLVGIPGLVLAVLGKLTIRETRTYTDSDSAQSRASPPMGDVLRMMWYQPTLRHLSIALILIYTISSGLSPWYAAFMIRSHGMGTAELGTWFSAIFGLGGLTGILLGGYLAAHWFEGDERGQMRMSAIAVTLVLPTLVLFLVMPQKVAALITLFPMITALTFSLGPIYALLQRLVPDDMRATMMATVMLLTNLIGMGVGPQIVGVLSDLLRPALGLDSLRYAMLSMSSIALWAGYHFWRVAQTVGEDLSMPPERALFAR